MQLKSVHIQKFIGKYIYWQIKKILNQKISFHLKKQEKKKTKSKENPRKQQIRTEINKIEAIKPY